MKSTNTYGYYRMPETVKQTATGAKPGSCPASHYLLAYMEGERVCIYAPDSSCACAWVGRQLPEADELRIGTELQRLHSTGQRTSVLEIHLPADGELRSIRVLCVRA